MDFETCFQIHADVSNFETVSPKPIQMLKKLLIFVTPIKYCHIATISKKRGRTLQCLSICKYITEMRKILRVYMVLGDGISTQQYQTWSNDES